MEAPGLHRYFKPYLQHPVPGFEGLIHFLEKAEGNQAVSWESYITKIEISDHEPIHLITSGDQSTDYVERVRNFSWNTFFDKHAGGDLLNRWRNEWKENYEFVLIDSRTGITDTGGVCTIYLPDILVLVFSANEQSFERGVQVANGVQSARRYLSIPRPPLAVLPLPGRFDGRDEVNEAQFWLDRFAEELKPFYDDWLPIELKPRQILELTKIPYITKFSFGEPLPVITQGVSDPEFPGFYLENIARLLVSDFRDAKQIVLPESVDRGIGSIAELRSLLASVPIDELAIAHTLEGIESELGDLNQLSELLTEAGVSLLRQQRFISAESYFRKALEMSVNILGPNNPAARSSMNHLGELLMTTGRLDEAEILYRQIVETDSDSDLPAKMASYTNLANVCRQMGRLDESLGWYRRALEFAELVGHPSDSAVLAVYNNLAGVCREMGRDEEAVRWYEQALQLAEMPDRPSDPSVLAIYNNLAGIYREMGRWEDAVCWYERALKITEMNRPPSDSARLATYNNLAGVFREMGRRNDAVHWYERALKLTEMTRRPGDSAIIKTYNNLAGVFREMGRLDDAIHYYERALKISESAPRVNKGAVLPTYNDLADLYREMGRSDEAIRWHERALDVAIEVFGSEAAQTATQINNLADILVDERRVEKAEVLLRRALDNLHPSLREDSPIATRIRGSLARILQESGRREEAAEVSGKGRFDVFISYSYNDGTIVRSLVEKLTERGIRVWFDQWELRPGNLIHQVLEDAIASSTSFLICIGRAWQGGFGIEDETMAMLRNRMMHNQKVIPILLPGTEPVLLPNFLRQYQLLDLRDGLSDNNLNVLLSSITPRRKRQ
ncbi:tetratricopeptide repeat protein [Nitrosomonas sp. Is35]|uniref:tetratricopeptide repeat protein n=1 Tax=Nitrosomonas sp. Is35 TaxID=3080534 RepID=UPI00294B0453|nr:tetratricopeptide repeat protein [Nitrosomonas sp. Is35]MDV6347146.1 tetratricopeptide repeat protein [Nitrosomonas sp. Is35]